jgi:hypothetical protein
VYTASSCRKKLWAGVRYAPNSKTQKRFNEIENGVEKHHTSQRAKTMVQSRKAKPGYKKGGRHARRAGTLTSTSVIALKTLLLPPQLTKSDTDISDTKAEAAAAGGLRKDGEGDGGGSDAGAAADTDCKNCEIPQRPGRIGGEGVKGDERKVDRELQGCKRSELGCRLNLARRCSKSPYPAAPLLRPAPTCRRT